METKELANGEVWELRGNYWHMLGGEDYAPVSAENFDAYAEVIQAGVDRKAQ